MELLKKNIHMNHEKGRAVSQITLDDDVNVPDTNQDIARIIKEKGEIELEDIKVLDGHISIHGKLCFSILYQGDEEAQHIYMMKGYISFDEVLNMDGIENNDAVSIQADIEDLNLHLINSRKISIRAVVSFAATVDEIRDIEAAIDAKAEAVEIHKKEYQIMQMVVCKKDTYRIKEEIVLPSNKPNIYQILWSNIQLRNTDLRLDNGKIVLKGEILTFILYAGEEEEERVSWLETPVVFHGEVECGECLPAMIPHIQVKILTKEIEVKPDYDGEERVLNLDVVLQLDIKVYEEESVDLLCDLYGTTMQLIPQLEKVVYPQLLIRNGAKCRVNQRLKMENEKMLQICQSEGVIKIDHTQIVENAIQIEGVLSLAILYISADDKVPMNTFKGMIPFSQLLETKGVNQNCTIHLDSQIEQLTTVMVDSEEIEVKAVLSMNLIVVNNVAENNIRTVDEAPLDIERLKKMPSMIGYIVGEGDTLWQLAKNHGTTMDAIRTINGLDDQRIKRGDKLLIIKAAI